MSDLISRQALLEEYDRLHVGEPGRARKLIEDAPSAQPERKTGKWKGYNTDKEGWKRTDGSPVFMTCSECFGAVLNNGSAHWNFCPSCGADMRGEQDDSI